MTGQQPLPSTSVPNDAYRRPSARPGALRLDGNEGRQPDPRMLESIARLDPGVLRNYPDLTELEQAIADQFAIDSERVVVTAGADDGIDRVCRAFLAPGREMLLPVPTFEMLYRFAATAGGSIVTVPWRDAFPTDEMIARVGENTTLIAVVSPNNPTGTVASSEDLRRISAVAKSRVVLLDHAYVEYADEDLTELALTLDNVVVLRTLSKAWGLAGCRVGYALASPKLASVVRNAGNPYPVSALSAALAKQALRKGPESIASHVSAVRDLRTSVSKRMRELGAGVTASQGNFVFAEFGDRVRFVNDALASSGVVVRYFPHRPELARGLRITIPDNQGDVWRLIGALELCLRPEALLFDMDGVLVDVERSYRRCTIETAHAFGVSVSRGELEVAVLAGDANNDWELTQRLLAVRGVDVSLAEVTDKYQALYLGTTDMPGLRDSERLIPPKSLLRDLASRLALGIVTGRPRAEAEWFLTRERITELFDTLICLEDAPSKPNPAPVREAMRRMGVSRAWFVGDTPDDMNAAAGAGALPIGVVASGDDVDRSITALRDSGAADILTDLSSLTELLR